MPHAKVGAMIPNSSSSPSKQVSQGKPKKRGITMEDLKKKTAQRLAQEQQQAGQTQAAGFSYVDQRPMQLPQGGNPGHGGMMVHGDMHQHGQGGMPMRSSPPSMVAVAGTPYGASRLRSTENLVSAGPVSSSSSIGGPPKQLDALGSSSHSRHSRQQKIGGAKSKLPHGLTVQELKEMTKARLQSEMAERHQEVPRVSTPVFPYAASLESTSAEASPRIGIENSPPSTTAIHQVPYGFLRRSSHQARQLPSPREAWETGSVASHNTINSDYLGSEYTGDELTDIPFNRSRSHPAGSSSVGPGPVQYDSAGPLASHFELHSPIFTKSNRRRAATMSPRPSNLHDRLSFASSPTMDTFDVDSPLIGGHSVGQSSFQHGGGSSFGSNVPISSGFNLNRPRTSSAPSMSRFMEEFHGGLNLDDRNGQGDNDLPAYMVETVLGNGNSSSNVTNSGVSDFSSLFRSASQDNSDRSPWGAPGRSFTRPSLNDDAAAEQRRSDLVLNPKFQASGLFRTSMNVASDFPATNHVSEHQSFTPNDGAHGTNNYK